jgi:hypothetical protein
VKRLAHLRDSSPLSDVTADAQQGIACVVLGAFAYPLARLPFVWKVLSAFLASRILVLSIVLDLYGLNQPIKELVTIWDGRWYLQIAMHGYPAHSPAGRSVVAFYPLYPVFVSVIHLVVRDIFFSGVIASLLAGGFACLAVSYLARDIAGELAGIRTGWLFSFAPGAAFLSPAYADGMAIGLLATSLIMLQRRRWFTSGVLGALASATSPLAWPIAAAQSWSALRTRNARAWIAPLFSAVGFFSFWFFLWFRTGTPFGWVDAVREGWGDHLSLLSPLRWFTTWSGVSLVEASCLALAGYGIWNMIKERVPASWWIFTLVTLASVLFDAAFWLTPRLLLDAFPPVMAIAISATQQRIRILLPLSAVAMVLVVVAYTSFPLFVFRP